MKFVRPAALCAALAALPHAALAAFALAGLGTTHAQLLQHLADCLPFNFH